MERKKFMSQQQQSEKPTNKPAIENPSFNPACPACVAKRQHDEYTWINHPLARHGYSPETGWTHPDLGVPRNGGKP
jgi:hypothetical protein